MRHSDPPVFETANERFERGVSRWFWIAMILATAAHVAIFAWSPAFAIEELHFGASDVEIVDIPDEIEIPTAPASIPRPSTQVIADALDLGTDLTIAPTTFEANPVEALPVWVSLAVQFEVRS